MSVVSVVASALAPWRSIPESIYLYKFLNTLPPTVTPHSHLGKGLKSVVMQ
jgi:hypothetical protein